MSINNKNRNKFFYRSEDFKELLNEIWKILKKSKYWFKYNKKSFKKIEETSKRALSIKKLFKKREKEKNLNSI